jgi:phage terminase large subunit-like protein
MARRSEALRREHGIGVGARAIYQLATASKLVAISSDAKALDGLNVQVAICDEIASHKTSQVYDVLQTALGKRRHPLLLSISTATGNSTGIGKQLWDYSARVLRGTQEDERLFALIYTLDDEDDPWAEASWIKANPSWGVAVQPEGFRATMRQARNNAARETAAKTRHLNLWAGSDDALFSIRAWRQASDLSLSIEDWEGHECVMAIDLASKTDLAALAITFASTDVQGRIHYVTFIRCYLNEAAIGSAKNASYPAWAADGHLIVTEGNETDFGLIESDVLELCRRFQVRSVCYDPWAATQFSQRLREQGVPMVEYRATTQNFSEPTKELDAAIQAARIRHDGNPVLEWCIGNAVGHYDARGNVYPRKARPENKIDAAIALLMTIGGWGLEPPESTVSVYETRGLLVLG